MIDLTGQLFDLRVSDAYSGTTYDPVNNKLTITNSAGNVQAILTNVTASLASDNHWQFCYNHENCWK